MKEIGGYFGLENLISKEYYPDLIALNNARNALVYILKAKKIKKLYIPYFLCNSVSDVCERENVEYEYYHIDDNFIPIFDKDLHFDEYLYIVNYYGQISNQLELEFKEKYKNIIFDNVQAFFQKPIEGVDTIYSCRKFFGVPDGGYLSTDKLIEEPLDDDISMHRMKHILGRYEGDSASDYYADFKNNDYSFKELPLRNMSKLTHNILGAINYENAKNKREENFKYLFSQLQKSNRLKISCPVGPYAYPFYCEKGMKVKKALADKKIFIATLWPNVLRFEADCNLEKDYAENILPLPCDQRYGIEEMKYMLRMLTLICEL